MMLVRLRSALRVPSTLHRHALAATASFSSSSSSAKRVLCVDVPAALADATCVPELVQRGHVVAHASTKHADELARAITHCDALLVAPETSIPRALLVQGAQHGLAAIAVPADAIDSARIDLMEATNQGIMVLQLDKKQVGDKFSVEAEIALSLLIALARQLPASMAATKSGAKLAREQFTGVELCNKQLGIVGLGQAGKCVVEMARAMGLNVVGYDPNLTHEAAQAMGVKRLSLDELYAQCDFVTFHAPLTGRTRRMFDAKALAKCKQGVKIISVAEYKGRNGLLDEQTLVDGLESGHISGVGFDTLLSDDDAGDDSELSPAWKALLAHPRVIAQTHVDSRLAGNGAAARKYRTIAENLSDALAARYYRGVANGVFMGVTLLPEMKPFLQLGESLGRFLFQMSVSGDVKDAIARVSIATGGGIQVDITTPHAKSAIQGAVMKGIMDAQHDKHGDAALPPRVSLLNSSMLAMTNGIDVRQGELQGSEALHLNNSITVEVETKSKTKLLVMGSVFGEDPRIVRVNEYTDFPAFRPEGNLLLFKNLDRPGAIACVLKELAQAEINIANFGLSRQANVELAMGILALDSPPSADTLEKLRQLPSVQHVHFARI
ncbi:TPA: hypothetical protein N0F65_003296 [Lagenidium giganteum]|uniref:D-3-phosphoglycerate dehydrogenase n=1 Tax=Lagenidium giganteum TaxID=4803 RepID=A0AAV2YWS4_9STRA|nr:TPA: hypothetical protein N0F65_003296 [Lagenidium giganteum]